MEKKNPQQGNPRREGSRPQGDKSRGGQQPQPPQKKEGYESDDDR